MDIAISALVAGILLSPVYGIGSWLKWQSMKVGTILPKGALTGSYGGMLSLVIKGICFVTLFFLFRVFSWWVAASLIIMWFVSGWIATLIERKFYANNYNMDLIVFAAEQYTKDMPTESAAELMSKVAPKWWIKLMPPIWQSQLRNRLVVILLPGEKSKKET
jgi:hypothetical protein